MDAAVVVGEVGAGVRGDEALEGEKPKKAFDCGEMKRKGQEALRQRLAGLTPEQVTEFWARRNEEFRQTIEQAKEKRRKGQP